MANIFEKAYDIATGKQQRKANDQHSLDALQEAKDAYDIALPDQQKVSYTEAPWLQDLAAATIGAYTPIQAQTADAALVGPSAMEDVSTDPRLKDQQMASLAALKELADSGGMTAADKANLSRIQSQSAQADRGRRDAILQNAAARGMGGSGMELLAQLDSSQAATDRASQQGLDIAGMAQQRALDALTKGGAMAGDIRNQDFSEAARIAAAKDEIARFNAQNQQQTNQYNTSALNNMAATNASNDIGVKKFNAEQTQGANQFNITGRQNVANNAADTQNRAKQYNAGLPQQQFNNKVTLANGKSGASGALANYYGHQGDVDQAAWQNLIGGGAKVAAGMYDRKSKQPDDTGAADE